MLSVIVPVYNAERNLRRCLDSLLRQGVEDYEIICVNDGSTDGSHEILKTYREAYPTIIKIVDQENKGVPMARNAGMSFAKGDILAFCDSDDYLVPNAYQYLLKAFWTDEVDMLKFCSVTLDSYALQGMREEDHVGGEVLFEGMGHEAVASQRAVFFFVWQNLYRRSFLEQHQIQFQPFVYTEDTAFGLDVYMHNPRVRMVDSNVYRYTVSDEQLTGCRRPKAMRRIVDSYCHLLYAFHDYAIRFPGLSSALSIYRSRQMVPCISRLLSAQFGLAEWRAVKQSLLHSGALPMRLPGMISKAVNLIMVNYFLYTLAGVLYRLIFIPFILPRLSRN